MKLKYEENYVTFSNVIAYKINNLRILIIIKKQMLNLKCKKLISTLRTCKYLSIKV